MKKWMAFCLLAAILLTSAAGYAAPHKLGIITPDADHGFTWESIQQAKAEIAEQTAALGADTLECMYVFGGQPEQQAAAIEDLIAWGAETIVLWPIEGELLREAAETIIARDVGLVVYDRLIVGLEGLDAEIMGDNESIGRMMGEYILSAFAADLEGGETLQYLQFAGDRSTVTDQRGGGILASFTASPYAAQLVQTGDTFYANWSTQSANEQLTAWLETADAADIESLDFIITHDDEILDGVLMALEAREVRNIRLLTGAGGHRETLARLDESALGIPYVTYFFSPSFIREAIRLGVADVLGQPYRGEAIDGQLFLIETFEISRETADAYRASDAYAERYGEAP